MLAAHGKYALRNGKALACCVVYQSLRNCLWQALHTSRVCKKATFNRSGLPVLAALASSVVFC